MHDLDRSDLVFESDSLDDDAIGDFEDDEMADQDDSADDDSGPFDDDEDSELAGELLSVTADHELDHFLGKFLKRASKRLRLSDAMKRQLGSLLKGAVRKVLPTVAGMAGSAVGGPAGGMMASNAAQNLSSMLGMELEGLSPEDQEFEAAKQVIRMANTAVQNAANSSSLVPAATAARQAVIDAARQHVPGLVRRVGVGNGRPMQGTWYRQGNRIVIVGV